MRSAVAILLGNWRINHLQIMCVKFLCRNIILIYLEDSKALSQPALMSRPQQGSCNPTSQPFQLRIQLSKNWGVRNQNQVFALFFVRFFMQAPALWIFMNVAKIFPGFLIPLAFYGCHDSRDLDVWPPWPPVRTAVAVRWWPASWTPRTGATSAQRSLWLVVHPDGKWPSQQSTVTGFMVILNLVVIH